MLAGCAKITPPSMWIWIKSVLSISTCTDEIPAVRVKIIAFTDLDMDTRQNGARYFGASTSVQGSVRCIATDKLHPAMQASFLLINEVVGNWRCEPLVSSFLPLLSSLSIYLSLSISLSLSLSLSLSVSVSLSFSPA